MGHKYSERPAEVSDTATSYIFMTALALIANIRPSQHSDHRLVVRT